MHLEIRIYFCRKQSTLQAWELLHRIIPSLSCDYARLDWQIRKLDSSWLWPTQAQCAWPLFYPTFQTAQRCTERASWLVLFWLECRLRWSCRSALRFGQPWLAHHLLIFPHAVCSQLSMRVCLLCWQHRDLVEINRRTLNPGPLVRQVSRLVEP